MYLSAVLLPGDFYLVSQYPKLGSILPCFCKLAQIYNLLQYNVTIYGLNKGKNIKTHKP